MSQFASKFFVIEPQTSEVVGEGDTAQDALFEAEFLIADEPVDDGVEFILCETKAVYKTASAGVRLVPSSK